MFEKLGLSRELLDTIRDLGFTKPTEIQGMSIPPIMEGKDVIGESATGSGKTLAFGCGIVERVVSKQGLQALILTPTRELAEQVKNSLSKFAHKKNLSIITIYGGVSMGPQVSGLSRAEVVVATPGRLLDHLQRGTINLSKINLLVLDEADRMFDMGFIDDVERIIKNCPTERQTLFFSATISQKIKSLANKYMRKPIIVAAEKHVDPAKLKQVYYDVPRNIKLSLLIQLLKNEKRGLVMVFCNSRRTVDFVVKNLKINKIDAIAIHGGLSQNKRTRTIDLFNGARVSILVCTDVASRGLHIDNVSHIYNYELPKDAKDYVHRIGRTARAGEEGKVINLLCDYDYDNFSRIQRDYSNFNIEKLEKPLIEKVLTVKRDDRREDRWGRGNFNRSRNDNRGFQNRYGKGPRRDNFSRPMGENTGERRGNFRPRENSFGQKRNSFGRRKDNANRSRGNSKPGGKRFFNKRN